MITLAMAQMVYFVWLQAPFTGGEDGLQGVPRGKLFGLVPLESDIAMYYVVLAVFVAVFLVIIRIVHSPYGQVLKAIRENEPRAISLGYDVDRYKLLAFVLSTALAGLAGSMKTLVLGFATLSDAHWSLSGEVVLMTLLGGMGTFAGPVLGAFTIIGLQNFLADRVGSWVTVIIGAIFVVCVVAFRRGFVGELMAWQQRRKGKARTEAAAEVQRSNRSVAAGLRRRDPQVPVRRQRRDPPARRALQVALLDQVGLDHVLDRARLLADRRGHVVQAHRAAVEAVDHRLEQLAVHHVEALRVDVEHRQRQLGERLADRPSPFTSA